MGEFIVAKKSRANFSARRVVAASAAAVSAAALTPGVANAFEVQLPFSGQTIALPGVEELPTPQQYLDQAQRFLPDPGTIAEGLGSSVADVVPATSSSAIADQLPMPDAAPAVGSSVGQQIVDIALSKVGAPYVFGAAGPDAFDCSGFTSWVYAQVGKNIPRTAEAQAAGGQQVSRDALQPGDIVSFYGASHVGIYIGDGQIVDALNDTVPVGVRSLDYMPFNNAVRF